MPKSLFPLLQISLCTFGYLYATSDITQAQITSDTTVNTQVNQNGNVAEITGGETRGSNLFHSFQDFSVRTGNEAFFDNASNISNIFSRVTGGNISNIDGTIRANGSASLFLINPAGIIFGEGASLDIGGSFYGSSASSILFEDGEFSAADLENPPLLTINAPIGLGFRDNPGEIINRSDLADVEVFEDSFLSEEANNRIFNDDFDSERIFADEIPLEVDERFDNGELLEEILLDLEIISQDDFISETFETVTPIGLQISEGKDFALIGGNVSIERSAITAPGGKVTLGGLSQAGVVDLNEDSSFIFPDNIDKADVTVGGDYVLVNPPDVPFEVETPDRITEINVVSDNGGFIDLQAHNLVLDGATLHLELNEESSANSIAGNIDLNADFITADFSNINLSTFNGTIGNINLSANSFISVSNSSMFLGTIESGTAGNLNINANNSISFNNNAPINIATLGEGGQVGDTNISANRIELNDSFIVLGSIEANTAIGDVNIIANSVELNNSSGFDIAVGEGTAGDVNLTANFVSLNSDSFILSRIFNQEGINGNGIVGDINLTADYISLTDSSSVISDSSQSGGEGTTGNIDIDTDSIFIADRASIETQTEEINASNINVDATESIEINGTNSSISSQTGASGDAGNINIDTPELKVLNGGQISANNFITETFEVSPGGGLIRNILEQPQEGSGNAGIIDITANNIDLSDRGGITALSSAGESGNINLRVDDVLSLRNNSEISATAGELDTPGNGGNITIDSQFIVAFPSGNNDITANAFEGDGGNISIATEGIFGIQERPNNPSTNDITASSNAGISGNISITTPDLNPVQGATELPRNVIEPEETTQQACQNNRDATAKSGLNIVGKGGVIPAPDLPLSSQDITINGESDSTSVIPQPIETSQGKIQPARGVKITENGTVILTAYRTNNLGERIPEGSTNCGKV